MMFVEYGTIRESLTAKSRREYKMQGFLSGKTKTAKLDQYGGEMRKRNNILIKEFFDDMILQKPTRENLAATKRRIKLFQNFLKVQNLYILEITKKDILKYLSQFKRLSKNTIRSYYFAIRKIYNFLMDEGYIQRNPCIKVKLPKQPKPLPEFYTDKELQDILNYYNPIVSNLVKIGRNLI